VRCDRVDDLPDQSRQAEQRLAAQAGRRADQRDARDPLAEQLRVGVGEAMIVMPPIE